MTRQLSSAPTQSSVLSPQYSSLVLVRHGETVGQSSIRYFGRTDVALSPLGLRQMERVRDALHAEHFDVVYTSTLARTVAAAAIIAPGVPAQPLAAFDEIHFGRWEGWTREEIEAREPGLFRRWRAGMHDFVYPEGEAVPAFRRRVADALRALIPDVSERVLIVAHKGVIATIVAEALRLSPSERAAWPIDLASIHVLEFSGIGWRAQRVNDTRHLEGCDG